MSDKEITDNVIQCYKSGSFDRIMEFLAFRQKLRKSLQVREPQKLFLASFIRMRKAGRSQPDRIGF
uniref:Uncharacterized protein n=1 Tax=Romanomermis culicivorax TaxID=13658 RepID=A0A915JL72_ROMCU